MSYDPESEVDRLCCKLDETEKERDDLLARVKELESNCAAMVKVIECAGSHDHSDGDEKDCVLCAAVNSVLDNPNPGQYLIDQLHQHDTALVECRKSLESCRYVLGSSEKSFDNQKVDHALSQIQEVKP